MKEQRDKLEEAMGEAEGRLTGEVARLQQEMSGLRKEKMIHVREASRLKKMLLNLERRDDDVQAEDAATSAASTAAKTTISDDGTFEEVFMMQDR